MLAKLHPVTVMLLRVFAAFMFWQHGMQKLLGWFGGNPVPSSLSWFAGGVETVGAIALALGLFTRPVAVVLTLDMALLHTLTEHLPKGFFPPVLNINAEVVTLLLLMAAILVFSGPGKISLDALMKRRGAGGALAQYYPAALGVFRILIGVLFLMHGMQKLFGMLGANAVQLPDIRWYAGVLEFCGGIAIALGLLTRPVAFLCCGEMAVAYFMNHNSRGFWPIQNLGERAVLFCYIFLFMVTAGPGKFSLDGLLFSKKRALVQEPVVLRR